MKKEKQIWILVILVVLIFIFSTQQKEISLPSSNTISQPFISGSWDIIDKVKDNGYDKYLVEEKDFDYSDKRVYSIATQIKQSTSSAKDAVKRTALYTVQNIKYNGEVGISYCYNEKASTVLTSGKGDCVSMSRLNTALLRAQGIPARTMGGCLSMSKRCSPLFAAIPGYEAKTSNILDDKKRGFLHEYVEFWTPETGWQIMESTSGQIFDYDCYTYLDYKYDTNNIDRCTISDNSFIAQCRSY